MPPFLLTPLLGERPVILKDFRRSQQCSHYRSFTVCMSLTEGINVAVIVRAGGPHEYNIDVRSG